MQASACRIRPAESSSASGSEGVIDDVVVEYQGRRYRLPVLVVGSACSKVGHRGLGERLDEAIDGLRDVVVVGDGIEARALYLAARSITAGFAADNRDWLRLMVDLDAGIARESESRSRIREHAAL
jgi:hypothetical protein